MEPLLFFAVLFLMLLWLQGEKNNTEIYKNVKTIWDSQSLFSTSTSPLEITYLNPSFLGPTTTYLTKNQFIYSFQPLYISKEILNDFSSDSLRFQLDISQSFNSSQIWLTTKLSEMSTQNLNPLENTYAEVISIYHDNELYKKILLPGCRFLDGTNVDIICYLALIRLPLKECFTSSRFGCLDKNSTQNCIDQNCSFSQFHSWTCRVNYSNNLSSNFNSSSSFCIELISSSSIEAIFTYAKLRLKFDMELSYELDNSGCLSKIINDKNSNLIAGKVLSFCGDPLHHIITVDPNSKRIFFTQSTTKNSQNGLKETNSISSNSNSINKKKDDTLRNLEASLESNYYNKIPVFEYFKKFSTLFFSNENDPHVIYPNLSSEMRNLQVTSELKTKFEDISNFCVSAISLESNFMDLTPCINIVNPYLTKSLPIYMLYESKSKKLISFAFDEDETLLVNVIQSSTLLLEYSLRFNHFHSGWIFPSKDDHDGYLMLIGDKYLTKQSVHAVNLSKNKFQTSNSFQSTAFQI